MGMTPSISSATSGFAAGFVPRAIRTTMPASFAEEVSSIAANEDESEMMLLDEKDDAPQDAIDIADWSGDCKNATDELLVQAAKSGHNGAFDELNSRYRVRMRQKIYSIVRNWDDADDVVQETFFKAFSCLHQFRGTSKFSTWLFRIAVNRALMALRKRNSTREVSYDGVPTPDRKETQTWDFADPSPNPEQLYLERQRRQCVHDAVKGLPKSLCSVLGKFHYEENSLIEVAESLGISMAAAKSRILRARVALRTTMRKRLRKANKPCSGARNAGFATQSPRLRQARAGEHWE